MTVAGQLLEKQKDNSDMENIPAQLSPFVFVRDDMKPYTSNNLNKFWKDACSKVGIKIKMYNGFRHSLGCQLLDQGKDLALVQGVKSR